LKEADQVADGAMAVLGVAERELRVDVVAVAAPVARGGQVAGLLEVLDDLGCGSFGDGDLEGDVAEPDRRVGGDGLEDVGVVGNEPKLVIAIFLNSTS
jgi:hypothetical protein